MSQLSQPFITKFPTDSSYILTQRQTPEYMGANVHPEIFPDAQNIWINDSLWEFLQLEFPKDSPDFPAAQNLPKHIQPYATAYAGHQFGNWAGQLGDGRAIYAGEIIAKDGEAYELQWKGVGATPYSRFADGRAVLRSSIRECLMSEAMFHLGVPTTRCLSLALTGENVLRDIMYDGHPAYEKGAAVVRVAPSFLRFGHFELLAARNQESLLQKLADDTIERYFPEITNRNSTNNPYLALFKAIVEASVEMLVGWYRVGFTHGVMNTDNCSILGLTIDYGPYGMLEEYNLNYTPNTTDLPGRRYAFGRQAEMMQWNLLQLANAFVLLTKEGQELEKLLDYFGKLFWERFDEMMVQKFGLDSVLSNDAEWVKNWQNMMSENQLDFTLFFKALEDWREENSSYEAFPVASISYLPENLINKNQIHDFLVSYMDRLNSNKISLKESLTMMRKNNPWFVLRNYQLFECAKELEAGSDASFKELMKALERPYDKPDPHLTLKRPAKYSDTPGCSMLSCSS